METVRAIVGIDVSKKKLDIALLVNGKIKAKVVDNSTDGYELLLMWLSKSKVEKDALHVCMEATGIYYEPVALALHDAGVAVSVVNPACIKGFGHSENIRNKNDTADAGLIARYCALLRRHAACTLVAATAGTAPAAGLVAASTSIKGYSPTGRKSA